MRELWVKKTVYRRILINEDDLEIVKSILSSAENENDFNLIQDAYDQNDSTEYDQECLIMPIEFQINILP